VIVVYFKALSWYLPTGSWGRTPKMLIRMADENIKTQARHVTGLVKLLSITIF
jgi:hypothetical protein